MFLDSQSTRSTLDTPGVIEMLCATDVLLVNVSEAIQLTGATSRDEAGKRLVEFTPLVVLKSGAEGAFAYTPTGLTHAPALTVTALDTTGAGDCFNAGFVAAYLRGDSLETQLRLGNICGALSTTAHGTVAPPTLEAALQYL